MNAIKILGTASGTLIVAFSLNAWSQTSEPADSSTQSNMSSGAGTSAHATRQANRALSKKVMHALSGGHVDTSRVNVVAKGSAVTLVGSVPDPAQIDKAAAVAKGVPGVTSVKNSLSVTAGQ
ncbi:MAG TPA: BON domain-containing protein [Paraburkholderia sp.]|nr:BON domain-containing protein [Paraburkholderia sp.]